MKFKIFLILLAFLSLKPTLFNSQRVQNTRFKSLKCYTENKSAIDIRYCRVKVTRNASFLSMNWTWLQTFTKPITLRAWMSYKYGNIYRQVVRVPGFEICEMLRNYELLPPFIKAFFDVFGESFRPVLKGCPYHGEMNLMVALDDTKWPSIFPTGMYKIEGTISSESPKYVIFGGVFEIHVKSSILTSF